MDATDAKILDQAETDGEAVRAKATYPDGGSVWISGRNIARIREWCDGHRWVGAGITVYRIHS